MFEPIDRPIKPCIDCKWTLSILRGKPIILLHCETCARWFRASQFRYVGDGIIEAVCDGNGVCMADMFKCDCLIKLITVGYINKCCKCGYAPHTTVTMHIDSYNSLHRLLQRVLWRKANDVNNSDFMYRNCHFPKTAFSQRCGADKYLIEAYLRAFPAMRGEVEKYQAQRKEEQRKHREDVLIQIDY